MDTNEKVLSKLHETKGTEISLKIKEQIDLEPYNNSFCEILPNIY